MHNIAAIHFCRGQKSDFGCKVTHTTIHKICKVTQHNTTNWDRRAVQRIPKAVQRSALCRSRRELSNARLSGFGERANSGGCTISSSILTVQRYLWSAHVLQLPEELIHCRMFYLVIVRSVFKSFSPLNRSLRSNFCLKTADLFCYFLPIFVKLS